jgi:HlyD family secretion protein
LPIGFGQLHVEVDIAETEIARSRESAAAFASVRCRVERQFSVAIVRLEPSVTAKKSLTGGASERVDTRVPQIVYSVDRGDIDAVPGQQVDVCIDWPSDKPG